MAVNRVVYTALFGGYDNLINPKEVSANCDYICFTDRPDLCGDVWQCRVVEPCGLSSALLNRQYKIKAHEFLSSYSQSIYIDSNIIIKSNLDPVFDNINYGSLFAPKHPVRDCIFAELDACLRSGKIGLGTREALRDFLKDRQYPISNGLSENGILLRKHNDPQIIALMDDWWDFVLNVCSRDQLSFRYLAWERGVTVFRLKYGCRRPNPFFAYRGHIGGEKRTMLRSLSKFVSDRRADNWAFFVFAKMTDYLKHSRGARPRR